MYRLLQRIVLAFRLCAGLSIDSERLSDSQHDRLGAVASEATPCTNIGIDLLKKGGNAADAMVGTVFCVGVIGMYHSGIGGGGFMLVRGSDGAYEVIDFREQAPAAAGRNMYKNNYNGSIYGGLSSGVPGEIRGLEHLHTKYGVLPWSTIMQGAIHVARHGFVVNAALVSAMQSAQESKGENFLVDNPAWAIDFAPNGTLVQLGQTMTRRRYADTLETIAMYGADAFYTGAIANATITAVQQTGGIMTLEDLANYTALIQKPSQITYRDYNLHSTSAPSSGEVVLSVMKIFEQYNNVGWPSKLNVSTHRLDEAMRWGYAMRAKLADPTFVAGEYKYEKEMVSAKVAEEIAKRITYYTHPVKYYNPNGIESLETPGTSQICTADHTGMAVSLTTTINLLFGSTVIVPETGVIMNDEMNDFSIPGSSNAFGYVPEPQNYIKPGKRPLSSISPVIVDHASNKSLYFITGAAGGSRIITANIQDLWHVLDQNMTSYAALAEPRLHDQLEPNTVSFEYSYNNETVAFMASRHCNVSYIAPGQSAASAIRLLSNGTFEAAGEPRLPGSKGQVV